MPKLKCVTGFFVRSFWVFLAILVPITAVTYGQSPVSAPPMPADPNELIALVSQSNGLVGSSLKPWHLKASYKLVDAQGKATDEGTIEEFWASHHKRRVTYTGKNFIRSTYWTDAGTLESGSVALPSYLIEQIRAELVEPMPSAAFL